MQEFEATRRNPIRQCLSKSLHRLRALDHPQYKATSGIVFHSAAFAGQYELTIPAAIGKAVFENLQRLTMACEILYPTRPYSDRSHSASEK